MTKNRRKPDKHVLDKYKDLLKIKKMNYFGSRAEVWHEKACFTQGYLSKNDLLKNDRGRIVSKLKHANFKVKLR
jgi:hypothetical protein